MAKALIIVDMQNDFIRGALGSKEAVAIVDNVKERAEKLIDVSHLKKSHKGCCHVYYDENGELRCRDGYDSFVYDGALKTVFKDGEMCYVETFKKIRNRLNGGN